MEGPNWEQLMRNGQLIEAEPSHCVMLERFYLFYKGTPDEQVISQKYPAFYARMKLLQAPAKKVKVEVEEEKPIKVKKTRKSSPSSHAN